MVKSMTGYGRGEAVLKGATYVVEMRSVNHRYFEFNCRAPKSLLFAEDALKKFIAAQVSRGKVDVFVELRSAGSEQEQVVLNIPLAQSYKNALTQLKNKLGLPGRVNLNLVAANRDLFSLQAPTQDEKAVLNTVLAAAEQALASFLNMREREGESLRQDILSRCDSILSMVSKIEKRSPETVNHYRERLQQRMQELLGDSTVDEQRLLTETAVFADKIAVDEETVRLRSHISQVCQLLELSEPIGRKLDFIIQEMNREANTTGSKCVDLEISKMVVDIKAQIEKIREQVQNIE